MNPRTAGGALLVLGAVVSLVAPALAWADISGPNGSVSVNGFNTDGYITDGFAVVLLALGVAALRSAHMWVPVVATVVAVLGLGWALIILTAIDNFSSYYPGVSAAGVTVSAAAGVGLVIAGGALCLIGAVLSFFGQRRAVS